MLSAQSLACRRGRRLLFRGLELRLSPGSIHCLRGPNGGGKTSLLRILAGLSRPAEGQVLWNDAPLDARSRAGIVYIGHANALKDDLSLGEALDFLGRLGGQGGDCEGALARLGLASRRQAPVRTLSQGQRRRGALARLALDEGGSAARCWLLDEPYEALDAASAAALSALIEAHAARGGAVLLASHQPLTLAGAREIDLQRWSALA
ncbi:cytochrome c biogenesis heme-transporting ATPase CcmA [Roseateles violae]|uniref:Cytochrome c biogenesis heme-transporting ATPase CcmA n=1 Tax=Roseateles violae TaxID=3058042 RepID=A0ABT8DSL0_9BURK|nr:cytochrome c biogenesis heme-transporting ATPase CcmA [Pelomonas sp. PFR6]MDN3919141.1 cytochrome c biogenesis heme-transporting ATPase CcmA [Pelomonas sp. PFR6]